MSIDKSDPSILDLLNSTDGTASALGLNDMDMIVGQSGISAFAYYLSTGDLMDINQFTRMGFEPEGILRLTDINNAGQFVGVATLNGMEHGFTGTSYTPATADFDADGDVDGHDFLKWQRNPSVGNLADWQTQYGGTPLVAAVPEPGTLLLLLGLLGSVWWRRTARHG